MIRCLILGLCLACCWPAAAASSNELLRCHSSELSYQDLHQRDEDPRAALQCYKLVDDEDASEGKALAVSLNKRLLKTGLFTIVSTPLLKDLPVGAYRVRVRMKMQGMLHSLTSPINITTGRGLARTLHPADFEAEDVYQEFTADFEVGEGSLLLADPVEFSEQIGRSLQLAPEQVVELWGLIESRPGQYLEVPDGSKLSQKIIDETNSSGRGPNTVAITLSFPKTRPRQEEGFSAPPSVPSLRRLTIDWITVERLPEPSTLVLRDVRAQCAWRRPGELQTFTILLHNRTDAVKSGSVRLTLKNGLSGQQVIGEKPVSLYSGGYARLKWDWQIPKDHRLWGQEVMAEVVENGQAVDVARTWFTVHPQNNAIRIPVPGISSRFHPLYATAPGLQTHYEYWCPSPYDSAGPVPDPEYFDLPYISGNNGDVQSIAKQADTVRQNMTRGIGSFFYLESHGTGLKSIQHYYDHPETVVDPPGAVDEGLRARAKAEEALRAWGRAGAKGRSPGGGGGSAFLTFNSLFKETVDRVVEGSLKLAGHVPYCGIRWDGMPFEAFNTDCLGNTYGKTKEELVQIQVEHIRRFKKELLARFPYFEFHVNSMCAELAAPQENPFDYDKAVVLLNRDAALKELLSDGGSMLEEGWFHSYGSFQDHKNVHRNYYRTAIFESAAVKAIGGYHDHMMYSDDNLYTPDMIYPRLLSLLGGAHLSFTGYGAIPDSQYDLGIYATRFGEFFWDTRFRAIPQMDQKVRMDAEVDVWHTEGGWQRTEENNNLLYVLPVINPPVTERFFKNRFAVLPAPIRKPLHMTVKVPSGYAKVVGVNLLESNPAPEVKALPYKLINDEVEFDLPELILFKVIAVEFSK